MKKLVATHLKGITLIEVSVVVALLGLLLGLIWVNLRTARESVSLQTTVDKLVADIKSQQLKAMLGDTEGRIEPDSYGIAFGLKAYTLFHGASFNPADPSNFVVELGDNEVFQDVTFSGDQILFLRSSGEVASFVDGSNSIVLQNTQTGERQTITINAYGVITSIE